MLNILCLLHIVPLFTSIQKKLFIILIKAIKIFNQLSSTDYFTTKLTYERQLSWEKKLIMNAAKGDQNLQVEVTTPSVIYIN